MKSLVIALVLLVSIAKAQDSTMLRNTAALEYMRDNLDKAHFNYKIGTSMLAIGTGISLSSMLLKDEQSKIRTNIAVTGGVISLLGIIDMIASHRFIGRAGRWEFKGNSVVLNY